MPTLYIDFSDAQGQLTQELVLRSVIQGLWLSLLPARIMKIYPKMKALERSQHFSHKKYMGIFPDA